MQTMKLYRRYAHTLLAIENRPPEEWELRHYRRLERMTKEHMPHGAGIDAGLELDLAESSSDKLVFKFAFHVMDENGMYDGWIDWVATVKPSLAFGFEVIIEQDGETDHDVDVINDLNDYLYETLQAALDTELTDEQAYGIDPVTGEPARGPQGLVSSR